MEETNTRVEDLYDQLLAYCQAKEVPEYMRSITEQWRQGVWKMYWALLEWADYDFEGKVVVDFGCKYGHLLPMLIAKGASQAIGVEVETSYIEAGTAIFPQLYPNVCLVRSEFGYIPLQPETVDFVLVNEVISHINSSYLDTVYAEIARILKPGGLVLISDGNNIGNKACREALLPLYQAWENGPDGTQTDRDTVTESYLTRRKKIIQARCPDLAPAQVDYLAQNTSGLFGDYLLRVIDEYVTTGELIQRPYRHGICPTNPGPSGVLMERGFHPLQVMMSLDSYGIQCQQKQPPPPATRLSKFNHLKDIIAFARFRLTGKCEERLRDILQPEAWRTKTGNFIIVGIRE